ncbi:MAG: hypothetical protein ABIQ13_13395 [Pedococcus sp.]
MRRDPAGGRAADRGEPGARALPASWGPSTTLAAALISLLVLAACAGGRVPTAGGDGGDTGGAGSSQVSGDETFASPDPEPTTPESSDEPARNDNPAISVARLPIGGDAQDDGSDARLQCAHVTWIASPDGQIPRGTGIEITGVVFDPAAFESVGAGCGSERPSCLHYVFRTAALQCDLAIRATGVVPQDASPTLGFTGLVFCPDNTSDSCRRFVAALADEQQLSVSLNVPDLPPESTAPPTDTTTDSPTVPTTTTDPSTETTTTDSG